jgi:N-acetyltransferase
LVALGLSSGKGQRRVPDDTFRPPLRLVGRYVELVPLEESHLPDLVPGVGDRETVRFLRDPPGPTAEEGIAWIRRWLAVRATGPDLPFATLLRTSGKPIGMTSFLRLDRPNLGVEIGGTWLRRPYWRTPVNTEAKLLMFRYAFEEAKFHRVQLQTDLRNLRSQRAIEGLGAVPEARLREDVILPDGSFRTSVYYSVLEDEWPAVRARLTARLQSSWTPPAEGAVEAVAPSGPLYGPPPPAPRPLEFHRPVLLSGRFVQLAPLERGQLPRLIEAGAPHEIWTLLRIRHGDSPEGMAGLVEDLLGAEDRGEVLPFAILSAETGGVLGIARYLDIDRENRWVEVGTWLHPSVWRTPINTELKLLLLQYAFDREKVHRVQMKTDARNERSATAIERLGAVFEGERRDHYRFPDGRFRTSKYYSILDREWPAVRARLEGFLRRPWPSSAR